MASTEGAPTAYSYDIPVGQDEEALGKFEVAYVSPTDRHLPYIATEFQATMQQAWTAQFEDIYSAEEIALTVNRQDRELVDAQMARLRAGNFSEPPTYAIASFAITGVSNEDPSWCVAGVGKGDRADNRSRAWRLLGGTPSEKNQLADVSNIFVKPKVAELGKPLQSRGVGSSVLRTLLDIYPEDMLTVVYDYPANSRVVGTLGRLSFQAGKTRDVDLFGRTVPQTTFLGPTVGDMIETIEQRRPWLKDRQPIE